MVGISILLIRVKFINFDIVIIEISELKIEAKN